MKNSPKKRTTKTKTTPASANMDSEPEFYEVGECSHPRRLFAVANRNPILAAVNSILLRLTSFFLFDSKNTSSRLKSLYLGTARTLGYVQQPYCLALIRNNSVPTYYLTSLSFDLIELLCEGRRPFGIRRRRPRIDSLMLLSGKVNGVIKRGRSSSLLHAIRYHQTNKFVSYSWVDAKDIVKGCTTLIRDFWAKVNESNEDFESRSYIPKASAFAEDQEFSIAEARKSINISKSE